MSRSVDDMMTCFEFACLWTKNGLMSRFFFEPWELKLHYKARKLYNFLDYLNTKMHFAEKARRRSVAEIVNSDAYRLKQIIEAKIEGVQYHQISQYQARILYNSHDDQNGFWS